MSPYRGPLPVWFEVEPLAMYRSMREGSLSERAAHTGADTRDLRLVTEIIQAYLPKTTANELVKKARDGCGQSAIEIARDMFNDGHTAAAVTQMREALRCSHSLNIIRQVFRLGLRIGARSLRRKVRMVASLRKRGYENT